MRTLTISICDDNITSLSIISKQVDALLAQYGCQGLISTYSSSRELYDWIQEGHMTALYFLDIDMPGKSGLELASLIRQTDNNAGILFISAKEEYVFEAIKVRPFRFIRKSHFKSDIQEAVKAYLTQEHWTDEGEYLTLKVQTESYRFAISPLLYVQAQDNYLNMVTDKKNTLIRYRISEMEKQLADHHFIRTHKSYLVNYQHIYRIRPKWLVLDNGQELPISRSRQEEVQIKFKEYMKCS